MIIKSEQDSSCDDIEVAIKYAKLNEDVQHIIALLQSFDTQVKCNDKNTEIFVNASEIFYVESVDKKTFIYLKDKVYHTELRLYQLVNMLSHLGFVQVSKSCILNINVLESIKPLINSRMEATLNNGEKIHINRNYLNDIKRVLKGENER
ncbi:MAG: LytTR family transcriptional regulator [Ruminococcaceae bacterium]|nr:LytTR family transcriptional regulator [Oscillospiraceae bacterium]